MRNTTISIAKGIAIILMVIAHAEAPGWLCKFIFEFHMPLFFITAGYFFSLKYLNDEATFVKKRVKGLYWPFVKWAVFFLIIHNWMFDLGILNETFGNEAGGVTHPYSWHQIQQNLWTIVTATISSSAVPSGSSEVSSSPASYTLLYIRCCFRVCPRGSNPSSPTLSAY